MKQESDSSKLRKLADEGLSYSYGPKKGELLTPADLRRIADELEDKDKELEHVSCQWRKLR